jgi:YD repeat-containing protein
LVCAAERVVPVVVIKAEAGNDIRDDFLYDNLNRLTQSKTTTGSTITVNVTYDALGNITSKSDIGTYTYGTTDACGSAGPQAVKSVSGTKKCLLLL